MIGFILGSTGALLIGLVIGHTWGEKSGYKRRLNDDKRMSPESQILKDILTHTGSTEIHRIQCSRAISITPDMSPKDITHIHRAEYRQLYIEVAKELMKQKSVHPVIVDGDIIPYRGIRRICISFYIAPDPAFKWYPTLSPFSDIITPSNINPH